MITALISYPGNNGRIEDYFMFPDTSESFQKFLGAEGKLDHLSADCNVKVFVCDAIPPLHDYFEENITPDELNYIASRINALNDDECSALCAFLQLDFTRDGQRIKTVMDALENIDSYKLDKTLTTAEAVADEYIGVLRATCAPLLRRIADSGDEQEQELFQYVSSLEEYFDKAAYSRDIMEQNDMYMSYLGLVTVDWSSFFWREDRQVPEEYRIITQGEDERKKNARLSAEGTTPLLLDAIDDAFVAKMTNLIPGVNSERVRNLIEYAKELDLRGIEPKGEYFKSMAIEFYLVTQQYGQEIAQKLIDICSSFALNPFELRGAAWHLQNGAPPEKIAELARDGECDPPDGEELDSSEALEEFESARKAASEISEKPSVLTQLREKPETRTKPAKEKAERKKSGPEL